MSRSYFLSVSAEVAQRRGIGIKEIYARTAAKMNAHARQEVYYLLWCETKANGQWRFSLTQIANHFNRDHTTVIYGIQGHMRREGMNYVGREGRGPNLIRREGHDKAKRAWMKEHADILWRDYCEKNGWPLVG